MRRVISLGVDIGGTNTDIALGGLEQGVIIHKLPSTTDDPARGTVQGTREICEIAGIDPSDIGLVLHGTTVATNALLEHDGGRTGMLTTEGFRDVVHIGRHQRPHNFSLMQDIPFQRWPLVERKHRKTVPERVIAARRGRSRRSTRRRCVEAILELQGGGRSRRSAVCFLVRVPEPEPRAARRGAHRASSHPDAVRLPVARGGRPSSASSSGSPRPPRNAYVGPQIAAVPRAARGRASRDAGLRRPDPRHAVQRRRRGRSAQASHHAVNLLLSGPAAGVIGGAPRRHALNGHEHLITLRHRRHLRGHRA